MPTSARPTGTHSHLRLLEPTSKSASQFLVILADMHRRDRHVAVVHGPDVGALGRVCAFLVDAPLDRAIRSGTLLLRECLDARAHVRLLRDLNAFVSTRRSEERRVGKEVVSRAPPTPV